jgi:Fe2+ or Zn2+ uptake regulation protein
LTKHRKLILDIITSSIAHMTAEEIFMKAKQLQPSIAVGTVYRNLGLMTEAGEIKRISIPNTPDRYDKTLIPHEHLICQNCRELSDITVSELKEYIEKQTGIKILGYELNLRYICDKCKKEEA